MFNSVRAFALRLKEDCETYFSPVPLSIRRGLHFLGKWLYCRTYGMSPARADALMSCDLNASPEEFIWANRIAKNYGSTLNPDGSTSHCINIEESAFLAMLAYAATERNWERMLWVNGINLEQLHWWNHEDAITCVRNQLDLPPNTKIFYLEPCDVEADD